MVNNAMSIGLGGKLCGRTQTNYILDKPNKTGGYPVFFAVFVLVWLLRPRAVWRVTSASKRHQLLAGLMARFPACRFPDLTLDFFSPRSISGKST